MAKFKGKMTAEARARIHALLDEMFDTEGMIVTIHAGIEDTTHVGDTVRSFQHDGSRTLVVQIPSRYGGYQAVVVGEAATNGVA